MTKKASWIANPDESNAAVLAAATAFMPMMLALDENGSVLNIVFSSGDFTIPKAVRGESVTALFDPRDHGLIDVMLSEVKERLSVSPVPFRLSEAMIENNPDHWCVEAGVALLPGQTEDDDNTLVVGLRPYREQSSFIETVPVDRSDRNLFEPADFGSISDKIAGVTLKENRTAPDIVSALSAMIGYTRAPDTPAALTQLLWALWRLLDTCGEEGFTKRQMAERRLKADEKQAVTDGGKSEKVSEKRKETAGDDLDAFADDKPAPDQDKLKRGVRDRVARSFMRRAGSERVLTASADDGLSEVDAVKAAIYTLSQSLEGTAVPTLDGINKNYDDKLEKTHNRIRMLKQMVVGEHFSVVLQPIVQIDTQELHHFEALIRSDVLGPDKSPWELIQFAEEMDMIQELDLRMTLKVCSNLSRLVQMGLRVPIAVNLSGKSLQSPSFLRRFFRVLEDAEDIKDLLSFELTESSKITDFDATNRALSRIRQFGHKVALDDFGAGASGLQYLKMLDVDMVKIDGQYIRAGLERAENRSFLQSIVQLCKTRDIRVVGECIETEADLTVLRDLGVDFGQGWYFGKPMTIQDSVKTLVDRSATH